MFSGESFACETRHLTLVGIFAKLIECELDEIIFRANFWYLMSYLPIYEKEREGFVFKSICREQEIWKIDRIDILLREEECDEISLLIRTE